MLALLYSRKALPSRTVFSTLLADKVVSILRARFKIAQYVQDIIFMTPIKRRLKNEILYTPSENHPS